jgi:hypothetical protein
MQSYAQTQKPIFLDLVAKWLEASLKKFDLAQLTPEMMKEIRKTIYDGFKNIFQMSSNNVSDPALVWISDQFFKSIKVSDDQLLNDIVVINEYQLKEFSDSDITTLSTLFASAEFGDRIVAERLRRQNLKS